MVLNPHTESMFTPAFAIQQLMSQTLIGARFDDPVIPERPSRRASRRAVAKLRVRPARPTPATKAQPSASRISNSTTSPPRSVTS
jgi:hypothetical protein